MYTCTYITPPDRARGRRQHTAAAPRSAQTGPAARGPAGPAVAAAAGRQGSRSLEIGTAPVAVCAACPAPQPRPPRPSRDINPGAAPQPHAHRAPSGNAARQALDASPSPQAAGPRVRQARTSPIATWTKATTTPGVLGVLDLWGSSAKRHVSVVHGNRGPMLSHEKRA